MGCLECHDIPFTIYYSRISEISLPPCTNVTDILGSYNEGPAARGWDGRFWDKPYMAERELTDLVRGDQQCPAPCHTLNYQAKITYMPKSR